MSNRRTVVFCGAVVIVIVIVIVIVLLNLASPLLHFVTASAMLGDAIASRIFSLGKIVNK